MSGVWPWNVATSPHLDFTLHFSRSFPTQTFTLWPFSVERAEASTNQPRAPPLSPPPSQARFSFPPPPEVPPHRLGTYLASPNFSLSIHTQYLLSPKTHHQTIISTSPAAALLHLLTLAISLKTHLFENIHQSTFDPLSHLSSTLLETTIPAFCPAWYDSFSRVGKGYKADNNDRPNPLLSPMPKGYRSPSSVIGWSRFEGWTDSIRAAREILEARSKGLHHG